MQNLNNIITCVKKPKSLFASSMHLFPLQMLDFNAITYGILRFASYEGAFWPGPGKQVYGYRIALKFATDNGTDNTSTHAKLKVIGSPAFTAMTSQIFPFQKGMSHRDLIFTPWNRANLKKNHFL